MKTTALRGLTAALAALVLCAPAASAQTTGDSVSSDNVEFVKNIREVGDGVGAKIVGNTMFVTSTTHLTIYDITDAENPVRQGVFTMNVEFENEEVPTNGKILGISGDNFCIVPDTNPEGPENSGTSCLTIYDVSDPENVKLLSNVPDAGNHTHACVFECTYFFGSEGKVVDARDPDNAVLLDFNWESYLNDKYGIETKNSCHHQREIQPGIILGSCNPAVLFSVRPEDGASITDPVLLALGVSETSTLIHSSRWPREGRDKFMLIGQETNAEPQCTDEAAAFQTWDAQTVRANSTPFSFQRGGAFTLLDEFRPSNGTYTDGRNPYNALGCSVHWFMEHPTFNNGGLVAVAAYENGTRLLQVGPDGKMTEQGYFQPLGGSTSAPHWHDNGKVFYNIDYVRGVDVIRYTGDTYVPTGNGDVEPTPGATPGTNEPNDGSFRRVAPRLEFKITPGRDARLPIVFRTTGRLIPPKGVSRRNACRGRVSVQIKRGKRTLSNRRVGVRRDCTFAQRVKFRNRKRLGNARKLRFVVTYQGTKFLLPKKAKTKSARIR